MFISAVSIRCFLLVSVRNWKLLYQSKINDYKEHLYPRMRNNVIMLLTTNLFAIFGHKIWSCTQLFHILISSAGISLTSS